MDETEVEEAVTYYRKAGNKELKKINEGIRKVFKMFGGEMDEDEVEIGSEVVSKMNQYEEEDDDFEDIDDDEEVMN